MEACSNTRTKRGNYSREIIGSLAQSMFLIGYGDIMCFPYFLLNYGLGYLIPYFVIYLLVGIPLYSLEVTLGQFQNLGPIKAYKNMAPILKGIGWGMVISCTVCTIYFNLYQSACSVLFVRSLMVYTGTLTKEDVATPLISFLNPEEPFNPSTSYDLYICFAVTWMLLIFFLWRGLQASTRTIVFCTVVPFFLLFLLICLKIFGTDDLRKEFDFEVFKSALHLDKELNIHYQMWIDAFKHVVFDLGIAFGVITTLASYNFPSANCIRDAFLIPFLGIVFSFVCLILVYNHHEVKTENMIQILISYREVFSEDIFFFIYLMALIKGFACQLTKMETIFTAICDQFPVIREKFHGRMVIFCGFLLMLPGIFLCMIPGVFNVIVQTSLTFHLFLALVLSSAAPFAAYHYPLMKKEMGLKTWRWVDLYLRSCWFFITPMFLLCTLGSMMVMNEFSKPSIAIIIFVLLILFTISILQIASISIMDLVTPTNDFCLESKRMTASSECLPFLFNKVKSFLFLQRLQIVRQFHDTPKKFSIILPPRS